MRTTHFTLAATISIGLLTQQLLADDQPVLPSDVKSPTDAKAKSASNQKAGDPKKKVTAPEPEKPAEPLNPGPAVVKQNNVNVRGQAAINSDIITRLKKGDVVTVLEEVTLKKPKTDEPAKWARIALPTNSAVWAHSSFIDPANKTVVPKRLNLRSGPGENYSIVGRLNKGTAVKEIEAREGWLKIEPPADAYGFVAAHLLAKEPAPPPVLVAGEPAKPAGPPEVTPVVVPPPPAVTPPPVVTPPEATPPVVAVTPPAATPPVAVEAPPPVAREPREEVLVKRVVSREGIVKRSVSIQAPTYFMLAALDTGKTINYVFSPTNSNVVLKDYFGQRVLVTGEELLDERWPNTPVITVDTIEAVP
jgi:uncharacterized protein YgiM (DUF1202 family)